MDRNLITAILLSVLIIIGFQLYFQAVNPPAKKPAPESVKPSDESRKKDVMGEKAVKPGPTVSEKTVPPERTEGAVKPAPVVPKVADKTITIESPKYEAVLTNNGARIISFKLKEYKTELESKELINLYDPKGPDTGGPSVSYIGAHGSFDDLGLNFVADTEKSHIELFEGIDKKTISFRAVTPNGITVVKAYTFYKNSYAADLLLTLTNNSGKNLSYRLSMPWRKIYKGEQGRFAWNSVEILLNDELKDYYFTKIEGDEQPAGKVRWAGLGDIFFFKALVFRDRPAQSVSLFKPSEEGYARIGIRYGAVELPVGRPVSVDMAVYLGPKEQKALSAAGSGLERAQFFSKYYILEVLSAALLKFLKACYSGFEIFGLRIPGVHNYGIAIIILTILIKLLFIPLTHKSMKSMKRMQEIQPEMVKIKEKYKDDKQALNQAPMALFKEHKVNPLGGCWPIFLQLPVFIALYQALSWAIEMRHAPFVCFPSIYLCIKDLSAPDPYYVTPILMGATMVLQQWMTPTGGDPNMRKMMLLMPVVFTYLFLSFPSGLVLYWLVSNLLSITQQLITNRMAK
jgi:YidC/Oxa1 family membrane protein insertase